MYLFRSLVLLPPLTDMNREGRTDDRGTGRTPHRRLCTDTRPTYEPYLFTERLRSKNDSNEYRGSSAGFPSPFLERSQVLVETNTRNRWTWTVLDPERGRGLRRRGGSVGPDRGSREAFSNRGLTSDIRGACQVSVGLPFETRLERPPPNDLSPGSFGRSPRLGSLPTSSTGPGPDVPRRAERRDLSAPRWTLVSHLCGTILGLT